MIATEYVKSSATAIAGIIMIFSMIAIFISVCAFLFCRRRVITKRQKRAEAAAAVSGDQKEKLIQAWELLSYINFW